jgi:hypothetical protein
MSNIMIDNNLTDSSFILLEITAKLQKPDQLKNCKTIKDELCRNKLPVIRKNKFSPFSFLL